MLHHLYTAERVQRAREILAVYSDSELARLAGISRATVRRFRVSAAIQQHTLARLVRVAEGAR